MHQVPATVYVIGYEYLKPGVGEWNEAFSAPVARDAAEAMYRHIVESPSCRKPIVWEYHCANVVHPIRMPWTDERGDLQ